MQGQPNPNNPYTINNNSNKYNPTNNGENLTSSSRDAFNSPSPTSLTPPPIPSDGDFWDFAGGDPFDDDGLLSSFLDLENLGQNHGNGGGGVCLMDQDNNGQHGLQNHNIVQHGSTHLSEGGGDGEFENHNNVGNGKSDLLEGSGEHSNERKKRGPRCYNLAEIWPVDPDRAKRLLEGRQYMARSRQKKVRYLSELEEKAQFLELEATNLSAQLTTYQRDKMGLSTENAELKILLEVKQQQAELRDALSEALTQEVEKLKITIGGMRTPPKSFILGVQPNSPLASLSPLQPPMHYNLLPASPSTLLPQGQYNSLTSPSTLQSPLQSSSPFTSVSSPLHFTSQSLVAPSPSTLKTASHNPASSPSPRTRNNVFPFPKMSSAALSQLSPLYSSRSNLLSQRGHPANLPSPPK